MESILSFALYPLEEPVNRCAMHWNGTTPSGNRGCCSLLDLPGNLTSSSQALLWGHRCWHQHYSLPFFLSVLSVLVIVQISSFSLFL